MGFADPRSEGSGNPGATNVLRVGGKKAAAITLFGDSLKGFLPVFIASIMGLTPLVLGLTSAAAFLGHLYPVFFGFRGGKGVATMSGSLFGLNWLVGLAMLATWLLIAKGFKISSLAALVAMMLSPLYVWLFIGYERDLIIIISLMAVLLFWRHRTNIQRLIRGEEGLTSKKSS
jgi:glycerol-3-phosphate acyltransferase PlsY